MAANRRGGGLAAQAHGDPEGLIVRMICCAAEHRGEPTPHSEIAEVARLFDHLRDRAELR